MQQCRGENTVKKNPGLVNIVTGGKVEKKGCIEKQCYYLLPQKDQGKKGSG